MEHSIQAYLARLSTERLEAFVQQYYAGELNEDYSCMIPYIQYVLDRRKADPQ